MFHKAATPRAHDHGTALPVTTVAAYAAGPRRLPPRSRGPPRPQPGPRADASSPPDELRARTGPGAAPSDASPARRPHPLAPRTPLPRSPARQPPPPTPVTDHPIGRYVADFYWPDHGLIVETDGWHTHGGPVAFTDDRIRDAELAIRDLVVIRVTDDQVDHDLPATLDRLRRWFAGPGAPASGSTC